MKRSILIPVLLLLLALLAGCNTLLGPSPQRTPLVITATPVLATATSVAAVPTAETTVEAIPTATEVPPPGATLTPPAPNATPPVGQTPGNAQNCTYRATFLGDVTVPDNSAVPAGTTFTKTWRIRNDGTCPWGSGGFALHSIVQTGGALPGTAAAFEVPNQVINQGDVVDLSVTLAAPAAPGTYRSEWMLRVDNGPTFGVGAGGQLPLFAQVIVTGGAPPTPVGTCTYRATFLGDVTVPDNTVILGGSQFIKTWRVRNDGTCSWGSAGFAAHNLVQTGGTLTGPFSTVAIPNPTINQGDVVDLSVTLNAPTLPGTYRSEWKIQVDNAPAFGVGPNGQTALYAQIVVSSGGPVATRINFGPGATMAVVSGSVPAGGRKDYIISANGGQTMLLTLSSQPIGALLISVNGTQGVDPQRIFTNPDISIWRGLLPITQDYVIHLTSTGAPVNNFSLNVTIPQRIQFAPGAIQGTVQGNTAGRATVTYLLKASAGQLMTVDLAAPSGYAALTIYGLTDGQPLVRAVSGATRWSGQLPGTQDYVIEVVPATDAPFGFTLTATVQ